MESVAVSIQNVSKKFRLFNSPKERLWEAFHPFNKKYHREFWALKDINFDVPKGVTVGIVGRNGSGKSTLLQIICSVLRPTTGTVTVNGRISALLELGADFNPEFTGRENVLMKGIQMGFLPKEIEKRLPQIEAFADIGEFIDQPVKIYSSGMFVRLAFATAINIDPEILIVDEALAVGDAKFQHKCYQKFIEFQKNDKTIIFVTHDTGAIVKHCDLAILLESGTMLQDGRPNDVANSYYELLFTGGVEKLGVVPDLIEEGYKGFNIVYYMKKYYAFAQSLGHIDLTQPGDQELKQYQASGKCFVGNSLDDVKDLVKQLFPQNNSIINKTKQSELERFLEEIPVTDQCIYRKSYNKNEVRFGDKRAEIVDYLVVCEDECEPGKLRSGSVMDIYLKVKFHEAVTSPAFGFSIKSIDGIVIYASNTRFSKIPVQSVEKSIVIIFKFSIEINLHWGDIFITLGCGEKINDAIGKPIEIREDLIHLVVLETKKFDGFVELDTSFQEILRNKC